MRKITFVTLCKDRILDLATVTTVGFWKPSRSPCRASNCARSRRTAAQYDCKEIMSGWDAYITNLLESSDGIKKAAIVGLEDGSVWARSNDFNATDTELRTLVNSFKNIQSVPQTGSDLEGVHYIVPRVEDTLIFGKKGSQGFCAVKSNTAVILAVFEGETGAGSATRVAVEKLASYLVDTGY
ncbi:unnamed protein product [Bursaphelenchus xylophilus]|uniref:Profilin n=1 Tax=Bursaphelenchus xylophilus TaxID=6326 RepID=A0A1I7RTZ0_BURXY|nr:unnamed protein product [Bursaphelenchus xylophilus]CAG9132081.1 unnamed protein product [Bursaphelenchus xylophilus]